MYLAWSDTTKFLVFLVNKLLEKSPIRYGLVRNLEWLNPRALCTNQRKCVQQLTRALQILVDMHHVAAGQCDLIIRLLTCTMLQLGSVILLFVC